jgi:hypothetical protein
MDIYCYYILEHCNKQKEHITYNIFMQYLTFEVYINIVHVYGLEYTCHINVSL